MKPLLLMIGWMLLAGTVEAVPLVTSISPDAARPGDVLKVKGAGFKGTREVLFASGIAIKPAKFTVVTDEELDVVFPEYYRGTGSASMIVLGAGGVTAVMSDKMKTVDGNTTSVSSVPFINVVNGGSVTSTSGGAIAVVGEGGMVAKCYSSSACFVKSKGTLAEFDGTILFHEAGAIFGPKIRMRRIPPKMVSVHEITISPNVDPVKIKTPEAPQPFAKLPPVLTAITPAQAMPGDIVQFHGKNLSHVGEVFFFDGARGLTEAGFKATNDSVLRVEVPQHVSRRQLIIAVNPAGCAVNITEAPAPTPQFLNRQEAIYEMNNSAALLVEYIRLGKFENSGNGGRIFVIGNGSALTGGGGGCCFLVQNGGRLVREGGGGGGCVVFHEADAVVPSALNGPIMREVGKIIFSPRRINLDIIYRF